MKQPINITMKHLTDTEKEQAIQNIKDNKPVMVNIAMRVDANFNLFDTFNFKENKDALILNNYFTNPTELKGDIDEI